MKTHLNVLDGLRGTAAISVVVFHFQELSWGIAHPDGIWLRHAYLAVDFFFCLSGYVIGYAYDDRHGRMTVRAFMAARLIRLHPMVVMGALLGLASYLFDPFNSAAGSGNALQLQDAPVWQWMVSLIGGALMIPTGALPNRVGAYFPLNWPSWSLMWEYLANIVYALCLWRMRRTWLVIIVVLSAVGLGVSASVGKSLSLGWAWGQMLHALARISFSFGAGLLLFRYGAVVRSRLGFGALSLILVMSFVGPFGSAAYGSDVPFNWLYEWAVVVLVFPLLVALGAGAKSVGPTGSVCDFLGRLSYPIYMVHYALVMIFFNYHWTRAIGSQALPWVIAVSTVAIVGISYVVLVAYDEPLRGWLARRRREVLSEGAVGDGCESGQ